MRCQAGRALGKALPRTAGAMAMPRQGRPGPWQSLAKAGRAVGNALPLPAGPAPMPCRGRPFFGQFLGEAGAHISVAVLVSPAPGARRWGQWMAGRPAGLGKAPPGARLPFGNALPKTLPAAMPCRGPGCPRQGIAKSRASLGKHRQGSGCSRRSLPKGPAGLGKAVPRARRPSVRPARLPTRSLPRTGRPRAWPRQSRPATTRPPATRPRHATAAPRENSAEGLSAADTAGPATRHPDRRRNTATAPTAPGEVSPDPTPSSGRRRPRPGRRHTGPESNKAKKRQRF